MKQISTVGLFTLSLLLAEGVTLIIFMSADSHPLRAFGGIVFAFLFYSGAVLGPIGGLVGWTSKVPGALFWGSILTGVNTLPVAAMFEMMHSIGLCE